MSCSERRFARNNGSISVFSAAGIATVATVALPTYPLLSLVVANLRGSGHDLRDWTANLRSRRANLRSPSPNLRTGVLKEALRKTLEHMRHIPKSPEYQGNHRRHPTRRKPAFTTPTHRFAVGLHRFGAKLRRFIPKPRKFTRQLHRFETEPRKFETEPHRFIPRPDRTGPTPLLQSWTRHARIRLVPSHKTARSPPCESADSPPPSCRPPSRKPTIPPSAAAARQPEYHPTRRYTGALM